MNPDDDRMFNAYGGLARASIVEFLVWACTLDDWLRSSDRTTYAGRRDTDEHGRVLTALRFARDRHLHQMATTMIPGEEISPRRPDDPPPTEARPGDFVSRGARIYWCELEDITEPADGWRETTDQYLKQRAAYKEQLEGQEALLAMRHALDFLNQEIAAKWRLP